MTRASLLFASALLLSCGGGSDPVPVPVVADAHAETLPTGTFPTLDALCAAQRSLAAPHIVQARAEHAERYEDPDPTPLLPSCAESQALRDASVTLAPPYTEIRAIEAETGYATDTFLVLRTSAGWTALREAFLSGEHDDPGCPSILREGAVLDVHVDRGAIVVLTAAGRGWFDEDTPDGPMGSLVLTHARACGLAGCAAPAVIEAREVGQAAGTLEARERVVFQTTYAVGDDGSLVTRDAFER